MRMLAFLVTAVGLGALVLYPQMTERLTLHKCDILKRRAFPAYALGTAGLSAYAFGLSVPGIIIALLVEALVWKLYCIYVNGTNQQRQNQIEQSFNRR
jgi:sugar phosphate permease